MLWAACHHVTHPVVKTKVHAILLQKLHNFTVDLTRPVHGNNETFAVESPDKVVALQVTQFRCRCGTWTSELAEPWSDRFFTCNSLPGKASLGCFIHLLAWQTDRLTSYFKSLISPAKISKDQTFPNNPFYIFPRQTQRYIVNCDIVRGFKVLRLVSLDQIEIFYCCFFALDRSQAASVSLATDAATNHREIPRRRKV